jgi:hypothetical protein
MIDWARAVNEHRMVSDEIKDAEYEGRWLDWERWRDLLTTIPNPKWLRTEPWTDSSRSASRGATSTRCSSVVLRRGS